MVAILHTREKEIHQIGSFVSVIWNTDEKAVKSIGPNGECVTTVTAVRNGKPYIDFPALRERDGTYYEDDDSTVEGGLRVENAEKVAAELLLAVIYLQLLDNPFSKETVKWVMALRAIYLK
jgi:hypothetical protein